MQNQKAYSAHPPALMRSTYAVSLTASSMPPFVTIARANAEKQVAVQGYLAHKKTLTPLGPPLDPRHRPTVGS